MGNKAKSKANNADRYKKETSGKRITYNGDVTFKYNGDEVHSSIVDMEVKIPDGKIDSMGTEVSLREANKDDIADYLSDYYNIDVDPDNIKISKDDEVHIKDGSRYFWKTYENGINGDMLPCKIPEDVFTRLSKEDQKQFLADGNVVKGEVGDVNENTVTADAKRSYRRKNLEDHVVQRASGTSRRNDTGRSLGKTVQRRRGISEQVLQARGWNGPGSGLTNPEKRLKSNISFSSPNGISVKDEEANKLIKDSFGELSAWLQSKIAKAVDEMATMFVYYGDKDGDTIGRNYSEYNIIRLFKGASSVSDMDVKIPKGEIEVFGGDKVKLKDADKQDIADYLSDYYNMDTEPDNIKVTKENEVHVTEASRSFFPDDVSKDIFNRLGKEDQKQFLADGYKVKGEDGDVNENTVTADAKRSHGRKNMEDHVVQRASGTPRRNDTRRSLGKTKEERRGISEQVLQASGWTGPESGLTKTEKRLKSNISFSSPNGISVKDEEANKLIKDSFGELSAWLQSKIAKAVDEMATMFVYYGDKDGDTIGRNYSEYNIIRLFKGASSVSDMDVKIPKGEIEVFGGDKVKLKDADKQDIADYLSDYYNIDTEPDNIKVTKENEVHVTDASRSFFPDNLSQDIFNRLDKEAQKQFLEDGNKVKGENGNDRKDTVTADAERSHEQRNLGSHVVQRNNGTSKRNDTGRSLGKTGNIRRGIHRQIRGPKRGNGNTSGLTGPEKKIQSSISILTSNGIPVSSNYSEKLIKDSFGKLPTRLQSKIAKAIDEMATAFVYYGDKSGDTLARNYSDYNIIRLFKTAFAPTVKDPTLLHELLHNFQAAIENDSGKKDYGMNYITTNHLVDWSKNTFKDWKLNYLDNLLEQLKNGEGLTKDWKILVYDQVRHNPKYIDYICYQISKDEKARVALKNSREVYDELFVAKTLAQLNITRKIPEYRSKLPEVEKRLETLINDAVLKSGVASLNRSKLLSSLGVKKIFANGKLTKESIQAFGDYKDKDKTDTSSDALSLKNRIDKQLHKVGIPTHEETAQRAALYAAGVLPGKERMNILQRQFEDPLHIFKKYFPDGMPIYRLADGARRKMEKFVGDYSQKFLDVFKGLDEDERKVFDSLGLKANEMHRDPMQVINLDDEIHRKRKINRWISSPGCL